MISFLNLSHPSDVEFVRTRGQLPDKDNSSPLDGADGRGSCVWFNQASMFQFAELGGTVKEAIKEGLPTTCNALDLLEQGYFPTL